jgi:hypothetical protein
MVWSEVTALARHERGLGRQLSRLEEDLERCELRARYYQDRIAELKAARERLLGREDFEPAEAPGAPAHQGDPPALDGQLGGVLGNLMKSMDADTVRALGEAAKGIDMNAVLGALGGSGGLSQLAGALGGGGGIGQLAAAMGGGGASGGGLAGLLGGLGGSGGGGSVMDGITEVVDFFTKRPAGSSWSVKDLPQALKLLSSPNVRTLVSTASRLNMP